MIRRHALAALGALLAALCAVLLVAVALAAPDVPPPPQQRPLLVSADGERSAWWYDDMAGSECAEAPAGLEVVAGALAPPICFDAEGVARYTFVVWGPRRLVLWRGAVLEDAGGRLWLPLVTR